MFLLRHGLWPSSEWIPVLLKQIQPFTNAQFFFFKEAEIKNIINLAQKEEETFSHGDFIIFLSFRSSTCCSRASLLLLFIYCQFSLLYILFTIKATWLVSGPVFLTFMCNYDLSHPKREINELPAENFVAWRSRALNMESKFVAW